MINITKTRFILYLAGAFMVGALIFGGAGALMLSSNSSVIYGNDKLAEIQKNIDEYFLFDYQKKDLMDGMYKGYVSALDDPYSSYMNEKELQSYIVTSSGDYFGVGIDFIVSKGKYLIIGVTKNSPAEEAGVEEGDYILAVDGVKYEDKDVMASKIRGEEGTEVTIKILHNKQKKDITMTRREIKKESVSYKMLDEDMAYIEINSFINNTSSDFEKALNAVSRNGAKSLVLDLRDNYGGLVDQSVAIADHFIDKGVVCYVKDKKGNTEKYEAKEGKTNLKTVVLINENSASSSEILAAALKDNGYDIVGTKSFGKGVIQTTLTLKDGSALKLTVMKFLSPDKHIIHKKGILPEYKVKDKPKTEEDEQLEKAKELLN